MYEIDHVGDKNDDLDGVDDLEHNYSGDYSGDHSDDTPYELVF